MRRCSHNGDDRSETDPPAFEEPETTLEPESAKPAVTQPKSYETVSKRGWQLIVKTPTSTSARATSSSPASTSSMLLRAMSARSTATRSRVGGWAGMIWRALLVAGTTIP